ncbi:MAG TPA: response regulator [Candidatus Wallbacteria bacterium]|nr:response regulator [Candidatus Wallbacteria bacterium]
MKNNVFKVLLIEDNIDQAELIIECFEGNNTPCKIFHVVDGEEAINYLLAKEEFSDREKHPLPDLILLDLKLPKISGIEVLKNIKNDPELILIPVIIFTSSQDEKDLELAYLNHANSYVVKPLGYDSLSNFIHMIVGYWKKLNTTPQK